RRVCASPAYLNRAGVPAHPRELLQHTCLAVQENEEDVTLWHFRKHARDRGKASPAEAVRATPALTSNDGEGGRSWAVAGLGCVLRSEWDAAPLIKRGNLRRILSAWDFEPADVVALVPARRGISARVDGFVQFLKQHFQKPPWH
ncbi:LysR substrate-binding domain-containing protein, partial [Lactobacillus crispatus]|uniref:LysR substrate-binding domain-containing protein n=1 Tax=Lactobacillus crispatus TaxID=47770 RepID=UPI0010EF39B0